MYFKKILGLSGLRIIYAVFGLAYSILQVRFFGTSRGVEVFFVATTVSYMVISLTQSGQLCEFFLPVYLSIRTNHGKPAAHRAFSVLINRFAVFFSILLIIFYFLSPFIVALMAPGFSEADIELCVKMFRVFLIFLELQFINSFIDVTLNAEKIFGRVELAAILNSIISLILLILFYQTFGVWILVITLFVGKVIEFMITIIFVKKVGIKYSMIWYEKTFDTKSFFRLMFTTSGYVGATQIFSMIFTAVATLLPQGTYAIFKYVQQISSKASGILVAPLSTVFFSHFSGSVSTGEKDLEKKMQDPILYSSLLGLSLTGLVILLGQEIINVLWKSKIMSDYFLHIGYWMLIINFVGFTLSAIGSIYRRVAVSLDKGKYLYRFWIGGQIISGLLSYLIIPPLGWFGLSIVTFLNAFLLAAGSIWVSRKCDINFYKTVNFKALFSIILSMFTFIAISFSLNYFLKTQVSISLFIAIIIKLIVAVLLGSGLLFFRHRELFNKLIFFLRPFFLKVNASEHYRP